MPVRRVVWRRLPRMVVRRPDFAHRIALDGKSNPVWTLFITGPRIREWGFICSGNRWYHWTKFTTRDGRPIGGCGDNLWDGIEHPALEELD